MTKISLWILEWQPRLQLGRVYHRELTVDQLHSKRREMAPSWGMFSQGNFRCESVAYSLMVTLMVSERIMLIMSIMFMKLGTAMRNVHTCFFKAIWNGAIDICKSC